MKHSTVLALVAVFLGAPIIFAATTASSNAQLIVLSNSRPNITVIDAETNRVINTANVANMTTWGWNDDNNNYFDGGHLWVGMLDPNTNAAEVALLNLNTLHIVHRIPIGKETIAVYIGKPSRMGKLLAAKQGSRELVVIDLKTRKVQRTIELPMGTAAWRVTWTSEPHLTEKSGPMSRDWPATGSSLLIWRTSKSPGPWTFRREPGRSC